MPPFCVHHSPSPHNSPTTISLLTGIEWYPSRTSCCSNIGLSCLRRRDRGISTVFFRRSPSRSPSLAECNLDFLAVRPPIFPLDLSDCFWMYHFLGNDLCPWPFKKIVDYRLSEFQNLQRRLRRLNLLAGRHKDGEDDWHFLCAGCETCRSGDGEKVGQKTLLCVARRNMGLHRSS